MEAKLKHLDFIQGVVNRLSTNSFLLKGWSVVLISALFALAASNSNVAFVFLAYIPAIAFWGLDGYFLSIERGYRSLYDHVRSLLPEDIDFSMNPLSTSNGIKSWASAFFSITLIVFHGSLLGAITVVMFLQS